MSDAFHFKSGTGDTGIALLLPAVQQAREAASEDDGLHLAADMEPEAVGLLTPAISDIRDAPPSTGADGDVDGDDFLIWQDSFGVDPV